MSLSRLPAALRVAVVAVLAALAAGCSSPTSPSNDIPFSQTDLVAGTGASAAAGSTVSVNYTGWLYDAAAADHKGLVFDTSTGQDAFSFTIGNGEVIVGWDRGVPGMQVGGVRRLVIPPSLAYGGRRNGPIPANATLLFEIELVSVD